MSDAEDDYFGADNGIEDDWFAGQGLGAPRRRMNRPGLSTEREHIRRERAKLDERERELLAAANRFGEEPPVGTVITFQKHFPRSIKTYSYAAIRTGPERMVGAGWFLTGRDGSQPRDWKWLCDFIGDGPFRVIPPESGKSKFFNAFLAGDRRPLNMVLVADKGAAVLAARKNAVNVPGPYAASYEAARFEAAMRYEHHNPVAPFVAYFDNDADIWRVIDPRKATVNAQIVKIFPAGEDGERRARQSAFDRNRILWKSFRSGLTEPPLKSRVRSKSRPGLWAVREGNGWTRYNGVEVQGVRLRWETIRRQLGAVEPDLSVSR